MDECRDGGIGRRSRLKIVRSQGHERSRLSPGTMQKLTVVFDDACPTCTVGKNFAQAHDKASALDFVGMHSERGQTLIRQHGLNMSDSAFAFHVDGSRTEKSQMIRDVLAHNGVIGFLLGLPFRIPYISDKLYDLLALHRRHRTKSVEHR